MLLCEIKTSGRQEDIAKVSVSILNGYGVVCISDKDVPVDLYYLIVVTALDMSLSFIPY